MKMTMVTIWIWGKRTTFGKIGLPKLKQKLGGRSARMQAAKASALGCLCSYDSQLSCTHHVNRAQVCIVHYGSTEMQELASASTLKCQYGRRNHADGLPNKKKAMEADKDNKAKERMQAMFAKAAGTHHQPMHVPNSGRLTQ